jgi:hypothetical protein
MRRVLTTALVAVALACGSRIANANTIQPIAVGTSGSSPYTYHFELELTPNNGLTNDANWQSGLLILDFPGFLSASLASNGAGEVTSSGDWSLSNTPTGGSPLPNVFYIGTSTILLGASGNLSGGTDTPGLTNVVLQYVGAGLDVDSSQRNLIGLDIVSSLALTRSDVITTLSRDSSANRIGEAETFSTAPIAVPLPAAVWSGMSTLTALGVFMVARKRRNQ